MRKLAVIAIAFVAFSNAAFAETIKVTVHGMVCAFCATGIEKTFRKQPEVQSVKVDLPRKLVVVKTKSGRTVTDAKVKEIVTYSGYTIGPIQREK